MELQDKVALITGGSRGIGKALAEAFLKRGARVAIAARKEKEMEAAARELRQPGDVIGVRADISDSKDVERLFAAAADKFGSVDILVNCAGIQEPIGGFKDVNFDDWIENIHVNLIGTAMCCKAALPGMIEKKAGKIINFSGGGAGYSRPNFSAYAVSKAGVVRFTEILADELRDFNIQVNAVAPGMIETKMLKGILEAGPEKSGRDYEQVLQRAEKGFDSLENASDLVCWLASENSSWLSGRLISAVWDPWREWKAAGTGALERDMYTLRRIDGRNFIKK
ncbi:MAG: SDR family oxidoreductase [Candidatus Aminicenantes bacterium]|nr:SDR family oxidoreductase [Candidatus Aminicenantes bacterium]